MADMFRSKSTCQTVVERKLDILIKEFQDGRHEGSVISTITVESLAYDDQQTWRAIRKDLEDIGISVAAFDVGYRGASSFLPRLICS